MAERVRQGPCGVPACPEPEKASGQWTYIPEGNVKERRGGYGVCENPLYDQKLGVALMPTTWKALFFVWGVWGSPKKALNSR